MIRWSRRRLAALCGGIFCLLVSASETQAHEQCADPPTEAAGRLCLQQANRAAEAELQQYFGSSLQSVNQNRAAAAALASAQAEWRIFRDRDCEAVYQRWIPGTIALENRLRCMLSATRRRTHELWTIYLASFGSTPPVMPEPRP